MLRLSRGSPVTAGPGCGAVPPCPVQGSACPVQRCLPWGWASSGGLWASRGQPVSSRQPACARGTCHGPAQPPHTPPPQPDSLKPFPIGRARRFTEIAPNPLLGAPPLEGYPTPAGGWGDARGQLQSHFSPVHPMPPKGPATCSAAPLGPPPGLRAAGPTRHHHQAWPA